MFNLWIWKIFQFNSMIGVLTLVSSLALYLTILPSNKYYFYISIFFISLLVFFQYKTTLNIEAITVNKNNSGFTQIISVFNKLEQNFSENIDPNLYFFANHPRERFGIKEFEKFSYILLVPLLIGFASIKSKNIKITLFAALLPLTLLTLIGNNNPLGPFSLFPLVTVMIAIGLTKLFSKKIFLVPGIIIFVLTFIQIISYAKY